MPARRLAVEIVIKGDHPVDIGAAHVERVGDPRDRLLGDTTLFPLDAVQYLDQRIGAVPMITTDQRHGVVDRVALAWLDFRHVSPNAPADEKNNSLSKGLDLCFNYPISPVNAFTRGGIDRSIVNNGS